MKNMRWIFTAAAVAATAWTQPTVAQDLTRQERRELEFRMQELQEQLRDLERQLGQGQLERARELDRVRVQLRNVPNIVSLVSRRARLGVVVNVNPDEGTDESGALLTEVMEGSAADEAGLRSGDIIVSVDTERLAGRYPAADPDESQPGRKLIDLIGDYEPGDEVVMEYLRDGDARTTTVTLGGNDGGWAGALSLMSEPNRNFVIQRGGSAPQIAGSLFGDPRMTMTWTIHEAWSDMELVELNEDLGRYFGTSEGLLVIQPPEDETFGLQAGDVILNIGGREPRTPSRAMRLLQSYETGETVRLEIMRDKNSRIVEFDVPERNDEDMWPGMGWNLDGGGSAFFGKPDGN